MIPLTPQILVEARWKSHALADIAGESAARLEAGYSNFAWNGRRVAVAVGSRGIDRIAIVARAAVDWLKSRGASPFIVPAMGSHGGATPAGQLEVLASLGITEQSVGAEIEPATETVELGSTARGIKVFTSRVAFDADALLVINRVKPHTDFVSTEIGSGLRKMCVIGLGKIDGAAESHRAAVSFGYESVLIEVYDFLFSRYPAIFGLALVEDAYHKLALIEAVAGPQISAREPELLALARDWMPALPFSRIDVLIVDEIGKNISGSGMDTNIIGRGIDGRDRVDRRSDVRAIYARGLTPESHGNAIGLGLADIVSGRLVAEMNRQVTYTNALSSLSPATVRIPMHFASDIDCLRAAIRIADTDPSNARIVRVRNTLALDRFMATENYAGEIAGRGDLQVLHLASPWSFTREGDFDPASGVWT